MATASGSSASHGFPKRLRSDLPLIACGKCEQKIVWEYRIKKKGPNQGRIFYMCSDCEMSNFFYHVLLWFVAIFRDDLIKVLDLLL
jgi:hypothetical protein